MIRTMTTDPEVRLLSTFEVCELLHISRSTLTRRIEAGDLVPVKLSSRANRFRLVDVVAFIQDLTGPGRDTTVEAALILMAEEQAAERRPLCPACGKRRVNRGASECSWCTQRAEDERRQKRQWWTEHGSEQRAERAREAKHG
jgi:predicted DNA-binding transcriptional regulator AlpA